MPRKVQERGLYLRESLERTSDLLLMEESFVYTLLRSTRYASASFHLFFPPSICVHRRLAFLPPSLPSLAAHFSLPSPAASLPPLLLQSLALFDWTLSQDSPSHVQVKLLIASAAGGEERLAHCSSASPCLGREGGGWWGGYWGGVFLILTGADSAGKQTIKTY